MKITVLCVGKLKESYYREAVAEFEKRLSRYCKLEIIQVADERTPDHAAPALEDQIKKLEGERLRKYFRENAYLCSLAIEGKTMDSIALSEHLHSLGIAGKSHVIFVIGGSLGLDKTILDESDLLLSFSEMTFPHQLMRVMLLEQIYRSFRLIHHEPYHK